MESYLDAGKRPCERASAIEADTRRNMPREAAQRGRGLDTPNKAFERTLARRILRRSPRRSHFVVRRVSIAARFRVHFAAIVTLHLESHPFRWVCECTLYLDTILRLPIYFP